MLWCRHSLLVRGLGQMNKVMKLPLDGAESSVREEREGQIAEWTASVIFCVAKLKAWGEQVSTVATLLRVICRERCCHSNQACEGRLSPATSPESTYKQRENSNLPSRSKATPTETFWAGENLQYCKLNFVKTVRTKAKINTSNNHISYPKSSKVHFSGLQVSDRCYFLHSSDQLNRTN